MELIRFVELQPNLCILLSLGSVPGCLEIASPGGLARARVLAGELDLDEGVVAAIYIHVEVEGDVVVVDDADNVFGQDGAVELLVWLDLVHVGVMCSPHDEDAAKSNLLD